MDFFDIYQMGRIERQGRQIDRAERTADRSRKRVRELEQRVDRLELVCHALWELLSERTGLDDEDLLAKVRDVDLRDGELDGRVRAGPRGCPSCGRNSGGRRTACLYCGEELPPASAI